LTKTWFITGASKGFGREWAEAALERGDKVAATARRLETLDALVDTYGDAVLPIQLDVTDRSADFAAVERAADHFGALDVVVNNAGYGHFGMIEELTEHEVRAQMETNFFGALWVTQAALPIMRAGLGSHHPGVEHWRHQRVPDSRRLPRVEVALEDFSQSLPQEVAGFGIDVTLIEPGGYSTDWSGPSATHSEENPAYADVREAAKNRPSAAAKSGDPTATRAAILRVADADKPPLRIFFGEAPIEIATKDYESRLAEWNEWQPISVEAQGA
jgi:NAD(P)-dependent dehydrogenase (short-subunit alcohol dehydrogenase family)